MSEEVVPNWKFWHPLSIWKVLAIFTVGQVVCQLGFALISAGTGIVSPSLGSSIGAGLGGLLSVLVVQKLAKSAKAQAV